MGDCVKRTLRFIIVSFIVSLISFTSAVYADQQSDHKRLFIVSVPGLSFKEIDQLRILPAWQMLLDSSIGALNVRTPERGAEDTYLSIGSSAPAIAWSRTQSWMQTEYINEVPVALIVERYTGTIPKGMIVVPSWMEIHRFNQRQSYSAVLGLLGEQLKQAGIERYVFGNRDQSYAVGTPANRFRHAPLMLIDQNGEVQFGNIGSDLNQRNVKRPFGFQTNYDYLRNELERIDQNAVVVVELGDLDRLYGEKTHMTQEQFEIIKEAVLGDIDSFLGELIHTLKPTDELWLFSPLSNAEAIAQKSMLTPFFVLGQSGSGQLLTSGTTRQIGIVSYFDIATTILDTFNITVPEEMRGRKLEAVKADDHVDLLLDKIQNIEYVYQLRPKLIYPLVSYQVIGLLAGLLFLFWRARIQIKSLTTHEKWWSFVRPWICVVLFSIVLSPFILLFIGPWPVHQTMMIAIFYVIILLIGWTFVRLPILLSLSAVGFVTAGAIVIDGLFSSAFMKQSVLGYDPMIGARFYGIGNEYMGALIGAAILAFSALHQQMEHKKQRRIVLAAAAAVFAGIIVYLAAPNLGTNAGGAISASVAFVSFFILFMQKGKKVNIKTAAKIGITGMFTALLMLWAFNRLFFSNASSSSHIGKALDQLFSGRIDLILDIVYRKLAMNLHLIGVSSWSKLLTAGLIVILALSFYSKSQHFQRWKSKYPSLASGMTSILFGAVAAFFMNDSGLVAAAVMINYAAVPMLLIHLFYNNASHSENKSSS